MQNQIIYIQWSNGFGGLERITKYYESIFSKYDPKILIFEKIDDGISYNSLKYIDKHNKLNFVFDYLKFIRNNKNAIFHFQIPRTFLILFTHLFGIKKIVCQFHGIHTEKNKVEKIIWTYLQNKINIIVNSNYTKDELKKKYWATKNIDTIPNYIDEKEFEYARRNFQAGKFIVTYAGRLTKGKNLLLLLETIKYLDGNSDIEFRIYGDGPEKEYLLNKIDEFSIHTRVSIKPFRSDISQVYHESHLLIFLSLYETFGNVVAEAILTGLPALCYRIPPLEELIDDDRFFINKKDPELIASKILNIKNNFPEFTSATEVVQNKLKEYINNKKIVDKINSIYQTLEFSNEP